MQHERQRAEDDDDNAGDERHQRHMPRHKIRSEHCRDDGHQESAGRDKQMEPGVCEKKDEQGPQFGGELEQWMRLGLVHC